MTNGFIKSYINLKPTDQRASIKYGGAEKRSRALEIIDSAVKRQADTVKEKIKRLPDIYNNMKNNLTGAYNIEKRNNEEYIANTGNSSGSGYAVSKRQNSFDEYQKNLYNIDKDKEEKTNDLYRELTDIYEKGKEDKMKQSLEYDKNIADDLKKETERLDNFEKNKLDGIRSIYEFEKTNELNRDKLNETVRVNSNNMKNDDIRTENDTLRLENDIFMDSEKNRRENEAHNMEMEYYPKLKDAEINKMNADIYRTYNPVVKSTSKGGVKSGSADESKMTGKGLAEAAKTYATRVKKTSRGYTITELDPVKAKNFIDNYAKKYNYPAHVKNDAYAYLGL